MKFLVIGLGSMGKRRIRNLKANGEYDISGVDLRHDRRLEAEEKYGITTFPSLDEIEDLRIYDAFIISVSPDLHMNYAHIALDNDINCFIEASVTDERMYELIQKSKAKPQVSICPSCTLRFHPSVKLIKELVESRKLGNISNFSYHSGQYLPDWHPWEKISDYYVSKRETGGCREIVPFEMSWLNWIFGDVKVAAGFNEKTTSIDSDIDDVYSITLKYKCGVLGVLLVDVVSRQAVRKFILNGDKGQVIWDWDEREVKVYLADDKRWTIYKEPNGKAEAGYNANIVEGMYEDEIKSFLDQIKGNSTYTNTLEDDYKLLQCLYSIEKSNKSGTYAILE